MSHTNVVFLRNSDRHPVGVLAVHSQPDEPGVLIAASICAPEDVNKFDKALGVEIARKRLFEPDGDGGPRVVRTTTQEFEDAVALTASECPIEAEIGLTKLVHIAQLAVIRSGAPLHKLDKLEICINPNALAACERYARKGRGRPSA